MKFRKLKKFLEILNSGLWTGINLDSFKTVLKIISFSIPLLYVGCCILGYIYACGVFYKVNLNLSNFLVTKDLFIFFINAPVVSIPILFAFIGLILITTFLFLSLKSKKAAKEKISKSIRKVILYNVILCVILSLLLGFAGWDKTKK